MRPPADHAARMERALLALEGLALGDAFGERFFGPPDVARMRIANHVLPRAPWTYTDDTVMAVGILEVLWRHGHTVQDELAEVFTRRYQADPSRGYGAGAHDILNAIGAGLPWQRAAGAAFGGQGSLGNGGAMRVAPLGAYFADDLHTAVEQARRSAQVTHAHAEGQAGAIAVAVAAATAWSLREAPRPRPERKLLEAAWEHTPPGETRAGLAAAMQLPQKASVEDAARVLGNGSHVTAPDTVPLALWCAARHLDDFRGALWTTVSALGDRDTTCAMVGGIVALAVGGEGIPSAWLEAREPLRLEPHIPWKGLPAGRAERPC